MGSSRRKEEWALPLLFAALVAVALAQTPTASTNTTSPTPSPTSSTPSPPDTSSTCVGDPPNTSAIFQCLNGMWVLTSGVNFSAVTGDLVLTGKAKLTIDSKSSARCANVFFSDGSISIVGAGATLDVTYCAYMNGTFNVSLSENLDTVQPMTWTCAPSGSFSKVGATNADSCNKPSSVTASYNERSFTIDITYADKCSSLIPGIPEVGFIGIVMGIVIVVLLIVTVIRDRRFFMDDE